MKICEIGKKARTKFGWDRCICMHMIVAIASSLLLTHTHGDCKRQAMGFLSDKFFLLTWNLNMLLYLWLLYDAKQNWLTLYKLNFKLVSNYLFKLSQWNIFSYYLIIKISYSKITANLILIGHFFNSIRLNL